MMAWINDKTVKTNYAVSHYRYNGKELQNQEFSDGSGVEECDFGVRMQDPQLGVRHYTTALQTLLHCVLLNIICPFFIDDAPDDPVQSGHYKNGTKNYDNG
jgi:hypothetical protein